MLSHSLQKRLTYAYLFLLFFSIVFIRHSISNDYVKISSKSENEKVVVKTRNVNVTLDIFETLDIPDSSISHTIKMSNQNSIKDLIEKLRSEDLISYEITYYIDDFELNHVNRIFPDIGLGWAIFYNNEDITNKIGSVKLENSGVYSVKLIRIEELQ